MFGASHRSETTCKSELKANLEVCLKEHKIEGLKELIKSDKAKLKFFLMRNDWFRFMEILNVELTKNTEKDYFSLLDLLLEIVGSDIRNFIFLGGSKGNNIVVLIKTEISNPIPYVRKIRPLETMNYVQRKTRIANLLYPRT